MWQGCFGEPSRSFCRSFPFGAATQVRAQPGHGRTPRAGSAGTRRRRQGFGRTVVGTSLSYYPGGCDTGRAQGTQGEGCTGVPSLAGRSGRWPLGVRDSAESRPGSAPRSRLGPSVRRCAPRAARGSPAPADTRHRRALIGQRRRPRPPGRGDSGGGSARRPPIAAADWSEAAANHIEGRASRLPRPRPPPPLILSACRAGGRAAVGAGGRPARCGSRAAAWRRRRRRRKRKAAWREGAPSHRLALQILHRPLAPTKRRQWQCLGIELEI